MRDFQAGEITLVKSQKLEHEGIQHAFTTKYGGFGEGDCKGLNLDVRRDFPRGSVLKNFKLLGEKIDIRPENIVFSKQIHSDIVRKASRDDCGKGLVGEPDYDADALITNERDLPLIVFSADCVPILLCDPVKRAIAAVHAGWRGTAADIVGKTVAIMQREYGCRPENICAAIGPAIGACCFDTHDDVPQAMLDGLGKGTEKYIKKLENGKFSVDLKKINGYLLTRAGVNENNLEISDECTCCLHDKYWSHRFTKGKRGEQAAIITII